MPPLITSPTRSSRSKRDTLTITRSVGKALADVMNKDKDLAVAISSTESDSTHTTSSPMRTKVTANSKPAATITRDGNRVARPSLDAPRTTGASDKSTPKLVKRPSSALGPKSTTRSQTSMGPPPPPVMGNGSPNKPSEKPTKPRASLTLRGLSSALQPKTGSQPSALPKYKPTAATEYRFPRSGARKRLSDWDADKVEEDKPKEEAQGSDGDADDDDFVTVDRPISPLPRRATRKNVLPVSLSVTPSTPPKRNVLHKASSSSSSASPRATKSAKTATTASPVVRVRSGQPRPPSVASSSSQRATPVQSARKPVSTSRTPSARPTQRKPVVADSPISSSSKLSSPGNPFQLPETSGGSLLSPPLSPFLEGVSIDSIDAGDVSALLSTIISPTKPTSAPSRVSGDAPPQTPSRPLHIFPENSNPLPPQTPASSRSLSTLTTDPRQSVLSLRQFLENSGDLEHLLSQPLPSIFTPDARERLLSFGFSPGSAPPPFPTAASRPEPQTPCPVPDGCTYTSISQVLFPTTSAESSAEQRHVAPDRTETSTEIDLYGDAVELLKMQLSSAESQRVERDVKIETLERQLTISREAREREATELSMQVTNLEEKLRELLGDRELEAERRTSEVEGRLRDKEVEWERHMVSTIVQVQEQSQAEQERVLSVERRKGSIRGAAAAWACVRELACSELELVRSNKRFVEVSLAGLNVSMQHLCQ